jgi:TonB family protein
VRGLLTADNLLAYAAQVAFITAAGTLVPALLRLRLPRVMLAYWHALLVVALLLPALQPWTETRATAHTVSTSAALGGAAASRGLLGGLDLVVLVLAVGVAFRLLQLGAGLWTLGRYRRRAVILSPGPGVTALQERLGVAATFHISEDVATPATFGLRRPAILVPPRFCEMPHDLQAAVAAHELLHVRRRDWLFIVLEELAGAVLWFHPALWWLLGRIRLTREQLVDAEVVRLTGAPNAYLEALLDIARTALRPLALAPLFLKESHLKQRVSLLLEEVSMSEKKVWARLSASALAVLVSGFLAVWAFPLESAAGSAAPETAAPATEKEKKTSAFPRQVVHRAPTVYPEQAKKDGLEGDVVLQVTIEKSGEVSAAQPVSGPEALREAAVTALRQWRYVPAEVGPVTATVTMRFSLEKKAGKTG